MGNVLSKQCQFFSLPTEIWSSGFLRDTNSSALKLYVHLLALAQRHSAVEIETPMYEIFDFTGLHNQAQVAAGRKLEEAGLVNIKKGSRNIKRYLLCDPTKGRDPDGHGIPLPALEGTSGIRFHKPQEGRSARTFRAIRARPQPVPKSVSKTPDDVSKSVSTCSEISEHVNDFETSESEVEPKKTIALRKKAAFPPLKDSEEGILEEEVGSVLKPPSWEELEKGSSASTMQPATDFRNASREERTVKLLGSVLQVDSASSHQPATPTPHFEKTTENEKDKTSTAEGRETMETIHESEEKYIDPKTLERAGQDPKATSIIQKLQERFGARVVEVIDLHAPGANAPRAAPYQEWFLQQRKLLLPGEDRPWNRRQKQIKVRKPQPQSWNRDR